MDLGYRSRIQGEPRDVAGLTPLARPHGGAHRTPPPPPEVPSSPTATFRVDDESLRFALRVRSRASGSDRHALRAGRRCGTAVTWPHQSGADAVGCDGSRLR